MPSDIIFSCRDRMLQLSITEKTSEELKTLKSRVRELPENFMAQLAEEFSCVLSENKDSVQADIVSFYDNYIIPECFESTTRIASHMECMQVVEYLYRKYFCHMDEQLSRKMLFEEALQNHALHTYEASCIKRKKEESIDYVATIYEMLSENASSYVKGNGINKAYEPGDDNFLIENRKIYITGTALQMRLLKYLKRTVSMKQVSDALHDAGVLEEDCSARTKKFRGTRHYVIFRPALLAYYETKKNQEIQ